MAINWPQVGTLHANFGTSIQTRNSCLILQKTRKIRTFNSTIYTLTTYPNQKVRLGLSNG